jgi:hypothetical protein
MQASARYRTVAFCGLYFMYVIVFHLGWLGCSVCTLPSLFHLHSLLLSPSLASSLSVVHSGPLPSYPVPAVPTMCLLPSISSQTANCLDRATILLDGDNINEGLVCIFLHDCMPLLVQLRRGCSWYASCTAAGEPRRRARSEPR